ncbi:MAG: thymidylate synthase [Candidatus Omnitrophota bacterium]
MNINGNIPVFLVQGETLPEVWERAVIKIWENGVDIKTEYDKKDDPPSKDATMTMVVNQPFSEPRIHRAFPAGLEDLEIYKQEVVYGVHDHWINPEEGKWTYTYHKRLFEYEIEQEIIRQIDYIIKKLSQNGYSRRAQAITWNPKLDPQTDDPPCLQRIWCRLMTNSDGKKVLNMNTHWRSRDAYKAAFMNIFALTELQKLIADRISEILKFEVIVGRYVDISDSFHIYGSYYQEFQKFLNLVKNRTFAERTWTTEFAQSFFDEADKKLHDRAV